MTSKKTRLLKRWFKQDRRNELGQALHSFKHYVRFHIESADRAGWDHGVAGAARQWAQNKTAQR